MIHTICTAKNSAEVYIDLVTSEAAARIAKQPQLLGLVKEALSGKTLTTDTVMFEHDLGRTVGYDFIIDASADEQAIFYACTLRDDVFTRFIKTGKPTPTNHIAMELRYSPENNAYELCNVRFGRSVPPRPASPGELPESRAYWATHAVVQETQMLQIRTITKDCPY